MKNLIVNADDLGWTDGVNRGILDAFRGGIVTSTSLLANGSAFVAGAKAAKSSVLPSWLAAVTAKASLPAGRKACC